LSQLQETLEELELELEIDGQVGDEIEFPLNFKKLKKFKFVSDCWSRVRNENNPLGGGGTWMSGLVSGIKTVSSIELRCRGDIMVSFLNKLQENEINLNNLSIQLDPNSLNEAIFRWLIDSFQFAIHNLNIHLPSSPRFVSLSGELIRKQRHSLQSLGLVLPPSNIEWSLSFPPVMPKLKRLEIRLERPQDFYYEVADNANLDMKSTINFTGNLDYGKHFPSLKSLILWPIDGWSLLYLEKRDDIDRIWSVFGPFFEQFFPFKEGQHVCKTLENLIIPYQGPADDANKPIAKQLCPKIVAKLRTMFPNARNEWLNLNQDRIDQ
jgi:hypothetical protein